MVEVPVQVRLSAPYLRKPFSASDCGFFFALKEAVIPINGA
jgi:hypothetical protein